MQCRGVVQYGHRIPDITQNAGDIYSISNNNDPYIIFMVLVDSMRQNLNNHCGKLSAEVGRLSEDL